MIGPGVVTECPMTEHEAADLLRPFFVTETRTNLMLMAHDCMSEDLLSIAEEIERLRTLADRLYDEIREREA